MRQENYLIALFNKELLDLRAPLPPAIEQLSGGRPKLGPEGEGKGKMLTRALEWNLRFCLMEFLFDPQGRVRKVFLKSKNRKALIDGYVLPFTLLSLSLICCYKTKATIHFHGNFERDICSIYCALSAHVLFLPLF